jgi:predicted extracellular nuclease
VAFIYKPASVSPVGSFAVLDSSVDSRFNDEKNRPALAQTFANNATGGIFTTVVNHLKSKGSACDDVGDPDTGDGSGNCNLTRKAAAEALVDWLANDPTGIGDEDFLIIGDLNSYDKEEPIDAIKAGPDDTPDTADDYTDMVYHFQGEDAYSYVFDGQVGYLDHALANTDMFSETTGVTIWHINADEPDIIDYDTSFKQPAQAALYEDNAYRSSDHDPVIVGLELTTERQINELIAMVQVLVDDGTLNHGQGNALISKLENVLAKLARGNTNAAANQLGAFINQVEDFIYEGVLTAEQGNPLIKVATVLVEALSN